VTLETQTHAAPRVAGNPAELREVLTNMVFNALDAMPRGGNITLRVGQERNFVTISVQDTGVGMTDEVRSRIFEPFFTTKGPQNSGLGLSTSYGIIARHGGEIRVESHTGQGSIFTIALPVAQNRAPAEERREIQPPPQPSRILLIDDEAELCRIIQRALEGQGHRVSAFTVASEALSAFRAATGGFDLIITDLGMPAISGWDLSAAIRSANPEVPIVMITGWGDHLDNHLTQQYHIASVLAKPFDIEELLQLATKVLRGKQ
jgi:CheY-like chemotaxis protein/anti-sigma regulatory factor (Ser/Thr protein kinase)